MQTRHLMRGHRSRKRLSVCVTEVNELVAHVHMHKGHLSYKDNRHLYHVSLYSKCCTAKRKSVLETRSILLDFLGKACDQSKVAKYKKVNSVKIKVRNSVALRCVALRCIALRYNTIRYTSQSIRPIGIVTATLAPLLKASPE